MKMDPADPSTFNHKTARLPSGRTYHYVDEFTGPEKCRESTPVLLCLHGFPDSWYGWRYQIGPWARKGFRVVVPSMLGYGGTDKPDDAAEYTSKKLCADLVALLDVLNISQPIVVGHDWGSHTAARFALWHPDRLRALIIISVPYTPPARKYVSIESIGERFPNLRYQALFSEPRTTQVVENMLPMFLRMVFASPRATGGGFTNIEKWGQITPQEIEARPSVLTPAEYEFYLKELGKGMNGPLNYYRTTKLRYEEERDLPANLRSDLPVLFLWGTMDTTTVGPVIRKAHKFVERLQDVGLEGKGHWVLVEARELVTNHILGWLDSQCIAPREIESRHKL
ncbi:alpha/beta-hydrolase [Cylindrobasidium torrendii FP15055 ss-10]|uniref:Alpha/beta-hydrolase n=1 Tax=Cylindrobasidium torrendii FP15055 ss-10 TaxID=1314674 RepID=A0A0D7BTZ5_9AGAR|nr:alpha/beta-hydrolase [Cylindrobasidium torrendii FP15055 ss-10]